MLILSLSYGNDSIALIQWTHETRQIDRGPVLCVYADTGWASKEWPARVERGEALARSYGFEPYRVARPGGLMPLARLKRGWPRHGMQFCTEMLKIEPITAWLDTMDPGAEATCVIGVRREESERRANWPEHLEDSVQHGGRDAWFPLVRVLTAERDTLVRRAGFEVLPHRSRECHPCVNASKADLWDLPEERIAEIEGYEAEMGSTAAGKPRVLFRPAAHGGAVGIREVVRWANSDRGAYQPGQGDLFGVCDGGWCGS
jgi:3'-phosphoadenosine 5'-phosphosulfate sulfotransferase (PAPS reductase)/FAD synthetase